MAVHIKYIYLNYPFLIRRNYHENYIERWSSDTRTDGYDEFIRATEP